MSTPSDEPESRRGFGDRVREEFLRRRREQSPALSPRQRQQRAEREAERRAEQPEAQEQ